MCGMLVDSLKKIILHNKHLTQNQTERQWRIAEFEYVRRKSKHKEEIGGNAVKTVNRKLSWIEIVFEIVLKIGRLFPWQHPCQVSLTPALL